MRSSGTVRYRFGDFELNVGRYELVHSGQQLAVPPKVFDLLRCLLERRERLVTKQELLETLWPGQHVNETAVPWTINYARRTIGQRRGDKTPIETVYGRGYRWRSPVEVDAGVQPVADDARGAEPFAGREALLSALGNRLVDVKAGRGGLCVLLGDAGIGKTRCMDELAAVARTQGFAVWVGRSLQDTPAPVYFPWIQLLRAAAGDAAELKPTLDPLIAGLESAFEGDACGGKRNAVLGRLPLFEAVCRFLIERGRHAPLLLLLDDLHWADAGTVELLSFIAAELRNAHVLILAASREALAVAGERRAELMRHAERFDLEPLSVEAVAQYLHAVAQRRAPGRRLCEAVHRASAGYPLFVRETVRALVAQHGRDGLASVAAAAVQPSAPARDLLGARLSAFDETTRSALAHASVLGERFEVTALSRISGIAIDALLRALDGAMQDGFVQRAGVHGFRFRHSLFREVVYEQMATDDRMRSHRAAALLLQTTPDAPKRKSEIAHHHRRSLGLGDPAEVRAAALDAAQAAERGLSFADAARFYAWALEALALDPGANAREYAELLLRRARAQRYGGSSGKARATVAQLVEVAGERGYGDLLVRAARALRPSHALGALPDPLARAALERALEVLPESASALRLQATSLLAWLPAETSDMGLSKALSERALELAGQLGSREALAEALNARLYALSGPDDIEALLRTADEMLALDGESRGWISVAAYSAQHGALLQRGDLRAADAALAAFGAVARARDSPEQRWHHDRLCAQRSLLAGDFAAAQAEFTRLATEAARLRMLDCDAISAMQRWLLAIVTRGPAALPAAQDPAFFRERLQPTRVFAAYRSNVGRLALACGHREPAQQVLADLSAGGFAAVPKDLGYLHTLCNLAISAIGLDDAARAERLYALLCPYAEYNTPSSIGYYDGPVAHFLALLAAFLGRDEGAEGHFAQAIAINERLGLRPLLARSYFECARWSLRERRRDRRGVALRARAIELSDALGLQWLARQARELPAR